jgi:hypothetical protein
MINLTKSIDQKFKFLTLSSAFDIIYFEDGMFSNGISLRTCFDNYILCLIDFNNAITVIRRRGAKTKVAILNDFAESSDEVMEFY